MARSFEVVIAGGGVMGCAVAYFLTGDPGLAGRVAVIERDPSYRTCATTRSWGGIRQQFSTPENIRMSLFGAEFLRQAPALLAVGGEAPALGFREAGYLFLASSAGRSVLERNVALQNSLGAQIALLAPAELTERFPWLAVEDLAVGGLGLANEGWFDAEALLRALRRKAAAQGAVFLTDELVAIEIASARVAGVQLRETGPLSCPLLVNAAGPQAGRLAALAGISLPVGPRKRTTFVFDCRAAIPAMPLTIDPSGVAVRPEGERYIAIVSPPPDQDPECDDLEPDYGLFEETIWPVLARRIPAFEAIRLSGAWAGHYDYNAFDRNAILGPHPELGGFLFCNGFSGHGVQQAPAAGRALAELIRHGAYRSLDLSALGFARILAKEPRIESNIV